MKTFDRFLRIAQISGCIMFVAVTIVILSFMYKESHIKFSIYDYYVEYVQLSETCSACDDKGGR